MRANDLMSALSTSELLHLQNLLAAEPVGVNAIEADGFFTAIATAPKTHLPSAWIPQVIGERVHKSVEDAELLYGLLIRRYNEVVALMHQGKELAMPESASDDEIRDWCRGYIKAAAMDLDWLEDEYGWASTLPIGVLADEFDLKGEERFDGSIIEDDSVHRELFKETLADKVFDLFDYWSDTRRGAIALPDVRGHAKVGRNDPCPCGSGRKFKRCCMK